MNSIPAILPETVFNAPIYTFLKKKYSVKFLPYWSSMYEALLENSAPVFIIPDLNDSAGFGSSDTFSHNIFCRSLVFLLARDPSRSHKVIWLDKMDYRAESPANITTEQY